MWRPMHTYVTLRYVTLRYVTLHCITLHYITLHYITCIHPCIHIFPCIHLYTYIHVCTEVCCKQFIGNAQWKKHTHGTKYTEIICFLVISKSRIARRESQPNKIRSFGPCLKPMATQPGIHQAEYQVPVKGWAEWNWFFERMLSVLANQWIPGLDSASLIQLPSCENANDIVYITYAYTYIYITMSMHIHHFT